MQSQNWQIKHTYLWVKAHLAQANKLSKIENGQEQSLQFQALWNNYQKQSSPCFDQFVAIPGRTLQPLMFHFEKDDLDLLTSHLDVLIAKKDQIESLIQEALLACQIRLPSSLGVICIVPGIPLDGSTDIFLKKIGLKADASTQGRVIRLYISRSDDASLARIKPVIAHEYNHYVRFQQNERPKILTDFLITEGLAEVFSREITPQKPMYYTQDDFITPDQETKVWDIMRQDLKTEDNKIIDKHLWGGEENQKQDYHFLASEQKGMIGYTIGYRIVKSYINEQYTKKGLKVDWPTLTQLDAKTILNGSRFTIT